MKTDRAYILPRLLLGMVVFLGLTLIGHAVLAQTAAGEALPAQATDPFGSKLGWLRLAVIGFVLLTTLLRKAASRIPFFATDVGGWVLAFVVQVAGTLLLYVTPGTGLELSPQALVDAVLNAAIGIAAHSGYKATGHTVKAAKAKRAKPELVEPK